MGNEIDTEFFKKFDNAEKMFMDIFRQTKKSIVLQDKEEYVESMTDYIVEKHKLGSEEANKYAETLFQIWEEKCFSSVTAFDQEITNLRKKLFKTGD
jgi:hypothetical protein